jgi:hypothetical protein
MIKLQLCFTQVVRITAIIDSRPPNETKIEPEAIINVGDAVHISGRLEPGWEKDWNRGIVAHSLTVLEPWIESGLGVFRYDQVD